jgi:hypothetical protein
MGVVYLPALHGERSGARYYAAGWRANPGVHALTESTLDTMGLSPQTAARTARIVTVALTLVLAAGLSLRPPATVDEMMSRAGMIILLMFLLSPVLFPWYAVPLVIMSAVSPRRSLLVWTLLLPLTYLTMGEGQQPVYTLLLVHAPVWLILALESRGAYRLVVPGERSHV